MITSIKGIWVKPWENEKGSPEKRIIHTRFVKFSNKPEKLRIGVKQGTGYLKCGSENAVDWIMDFAVYVWRDEAWKKIMYVTGIEKPLDKDRVLWFEPKEVSTAYRLEVRRSGVDNWWPCYSIVDTGFVIDAVGVSNSIDAPVRKLHHLKYRPDTFKLQQENISITRTSTSIRYYSPYYRIGFRLKSAGLDFLGLDGSGTGKTNENLLVLNSLINRRMFEDDFSTQGPVLNPVDKSTISGFLAYNLDGETEVFSNSLIYRINNKETGLTIELKFTMNKDNIRFLIKRRAEKTIKLLDSSVFQIAFNSKVIPLTALGSIIKEGETGVLGLPVLLHFPGYAGIVLTGNGAVMGRFNSIRPQNINTIDFKLGEKLCEDGCYLLEKGDYTGAVNMSFGFPRHIELKEETPEHVRNVFDRYLYTSLPFRADTATYSNNGNSMKCAACIDLWAELCEQIGDGPYGVNTIEFLKNTIEIHLLGAPSYAAGRHYSREYEYENEYLVTGTAVLLGISKFLDMGEMKDWYKKFEKQIKGKIRLIKSLDKDGDGLVESIVRKGISGEYQWSTCWYDALSFGYKDAFSNAQLYAALRTLSKTIKDYGEHSLSQELSIWADKIKSIYTDTFMTENGWLAGWKCMKGKLHDYGFLAVNGAAVSYGLLEGNTAANAILNLWDNLKKSGFESFDLGLPGNIFNIERSDMATGLHFLPFGGYMNSGITLSQARHFINALYKVGMIKEADFILSEICNGLLHSNVIGGVHSGSDWKTWDGVSSGYEGLLSDQLGIFQPLIRRYGK